MTIANSGNYNVSLLGCDGVDIVGVTIVNGYSDGIDPDGCQDVRIVACRIDTRDDAIAIKTSFALGAAPPHPPVTVSDCHLTTIHNALKIGTETSADLEHIVFRNCTVVGRPHTWKGDLSSGVAIETVDGGNIRARHRLRHPHERGALPRSSSGSASAGAGRTSPPRAGSRTSRSRRGGGRRHHRLLDHRAFPGIPSRISR